MKTVLVTGIGGVVGQGILRNMRSMPHDFRIIGTNTTRVSGGNYLCDKVVEVPFAKEENYIPKMLQLCKDEQVSLIVPSTDYEVYYLSLHQEKFQSKIAVSGPDVTRFCLDKYSNYKAFNSNNLPFAKSFLPSEYDGRFPETVVKPREGRGSRNVQLNPTDARAFSDDYVVQEYLRGPEITTTFYVTREDKLVGLITFLRELEAGNTVKAEVTFEFDNSLKKIIDGMLKFFPFRGSINIQSIITKDGVVPFEINCRISGTNSFRSQFGFNDTAFTIEEYLFNNELKIPVVSKGSVIRTMLDIVYPDIRLSDIKNREDNFYIR